MDRTGLKIKLNEKENNMIKSSTVYTKSIGENVSIGEYVVIESDVVIGNDVVIHPNVVINSGVIIGDGVEIFPGAYIGKEPKGAGATARQPVFERKVVIGANTSICPNAVIYYDVEIGENTLIADGASIREKCKVGSRCIISRYVTVNYNTTIGDRTKIMDLTHVTGNCYVGNDVFISLNVGMANDNQIGKAGYSEDHVVGPHIEDGAAIGAGATLLPGVKIGKEAVVGAGSVVTKDVAPRTVVMGIPARFMKEVQQ
jgi:acetyltransferase-like isoleucine patch superfamily enzyme